MNIYEKLTEKNFQEILIHVYLLGEKSEKINVVELIEEIKQQVLVAIK